MGSNLGLNIADKSHEGKRFEAWTCRIVNKRDGACLRTLSRTDCPFAHIPSAHLSRIVL